MWLVYAPIVFTALVLVIAFNGLLPHQATFPLILLLAYDAGCVWMITERRKRKVSIPIPHSVLFGAIALASLILGGGILAWMGTDRLATPGGPTLLVAGVFMLLFAGFAPAFRLLDATIRWFARALFRPPQRPAKRPTRRPAPPQRTRPRSSAAA